MGRCFHAPPAFFVPLPGFAVFLLPSAVSNFVPCYAYSLIGLAPLERAFMESLLGLEGKGVRVWERAQGPQTPDLVVTSGDDRDVLARLRARYPAALLVLVGQPAGLGETDLPVLQRPLRFDAALRVLDGLTPAGAGRLVPASEPAPPPPQPQASGAPWPRTPGNPPHTGSSHHHFETRLDITPSLAAAPTPISFGGPHSSLQTAGGVHVDIVLSGATPLASEQPATPESAVVDALVIGGKPHPRHGEYVLTLGLRKMGLRVRQESDAATGLAAYAQTPAPFVFLDQVSLGADFLPAARQLVALRPMPGMPPHVALVTRHNRLLERLSARMYGCNWMPLPLDRHQLKTWFEQRGQAVTTSKKK